VARAVVFAYHNVGVRCLEVLLKHGVDVALVLTHSDNPKETIWFDSVAALAAKHGIRTITPEDANAPEVIEQIRALGPDFLFSFYYRQMLKPALLAIAKRGAFNMHGSLLPKYRGRVPVNWAIIKGETETGATLHEMVEKPDAGRIVDQQAVSIGPDDTAIDVFHKVTDAAVAVLDRALPKLLDGNAELKSQDLAQGSYFGGRKPEDGVIDWTQSARDIHNLVRAVAPPYPGATTTVAGRPVKITRTQLSPAHFKHHNPCFANVSSARFIALCGDGCMLRILSFEIDGKTHGEDEAASIFTTGVHALGS
jgi:methionyl-tRNA formyltransferase